MSVQHDKHAYTHAYTHTLQELQRQQTEAAAKKDAVAVAQAQQLQVRDAHIYIDIC